VQLLRSKLLLLTISTEEVKMFTKKVLAVALIGAFLLPQIVVGDVEAVTKTITPNVSVNIIGVTQCSDFTVSGTNLTCVPISGPPPPTPPSPPPSPGPVPGNCSTFTARRDLTLNWASPTRLFSSSVGGFNPNDVLVIAFTTGSVSSPDNNLPHIAVAEFVDGPSTRVAVLSTVPCDFTTGIAGYPGSFSNGSTVTISFAVGTGANFGYYPKLSTNTTYYMNVKNDANSSCFFTGSCNVAVDLVKPGGM